MGARLDEILKHCLLGRWFEVGVLNRRSLLEEGFALQVGGDELCALGGVFFFEVAADCATLEEDEPIVVLCSRQKWL